MKRRRGRCAGAFIDGGRDSEGVTWVGVTGRTGKTAPDRARKEEGGRGGGRLTSTLETQVSKDLCDVGQYCRMLDYER